MLFYRVVKLKVYRKRDQFPNHLLSPLLTLSHFLTCRHLVAAQTEKTPQTLNNTPWVWTWRENKPNPSKYFNQCISLLFLLHILIILTTLNSWTFFPFNVVSLFVILPQKSSTKLKTSCTFCSADLLSIICWLEAVKDWTDL